MVRLSISLLGWLQVNLDEVMLTDFVYDKVWALFVYLVVEAHQPHRRETLAALFWTDSSEERARGNLRQTLATLRNLLSDRQATAPFLLATRQTIQFDPNSSYSLDVTKFLVLLKSAPLDPQAASELNGETVAQLEQAIALYRGEFLAEVKTFDSELFEEWIVLTRERFHRLAVDACTSLAIYYNHHRSWQQLQRYAQRLLELEPWNEFAHQALMQVFAYCGQRGTAVQQYKVCSQILATQLQTEPDLTTTELYEQIRNGSFALMNPRDKILPVLPALPLANVAEMPRSELFKPVLPPEEAIVKLPSNQPGDSKTDVQVTTQPNLVLLDTPDQLNQCKMLEKVHTFWIKGVLEKSLHNAVLMDLGLEECLDSVAQPWNLLMQFADHTQRVLAPETKMIDVYDQFNHSFLILGAPGAGKTTLMLDLARSLLVRATQDLRHSMPVVFNLSSWVAHPGSLSTWLVSELQFRYQVPQQLAQQWIKEAKILPLLDGLDEVALNQREACVEAINRFRTTDWLTNLVVCSRTIDYEALTQRLQLNGAILVQPLTFAQTDNYLMRLGERLTGVRSILQQDTALQELASTPLMVNIIVLACQDQTFDALQPQISSQHWQNQLFATYIQRMLVHRGTDLRYDSDQVVNWLVWLARTLVQRDQTLFLIERLQPDYLLSNRQRRWLMMIETVMVALLMGIAGGMGVGLNRGLALGWEDGVIRWLSHGLQGMMHGLGVGLIVGISTSFLISLFIIRLYDPVDGLKLSHSKQWRSFWYAARIGAVAGISQGLAIGWFLGPRLGLGVVLIVALCMGIATGRFLEPERVVLLKLWRWSWSRSRLSIISAIALGSVFGIVYRIGYGSTYGWVMSFSVWLIVAISSGFTSSEIETKVVPNQGMLHSIWGALRMSLMIGISFGLANGIGYGVTMGWPSGIGKGLGSGFESGAACWLICGGLACIQHLAIRYLLCRSGVMPWNYAAFLDYAAERTFLRKVGGSYIFVHRLLLDYFATLD
ncbi:NACHT domain-containing protein [Phormidium tenue FACHB-886]|nr:NACHT domain-containing protein [Phormidium tenue FACHB-886]